MQSAGTTAQIFNDSYVRVLGSQPGSQEFFAEFYAQLLSASPEASDKFRGKDMASQVHMLRASVATLLAFYTGADVTNFMDRLAQRHSRYGADIPPNLYGVWLNCLIRAVQVSDPRFDPEVERVWREVFSRGIEYMISRYDPSEPA
jgi:hemoglobin-like flavoprotein